MKTITKEEYLKLCVSNIKGITKKNWYFTCFTLPIFKDTPIDEDLEAYDLVITQSGLQVLIPTDEGKLELVPISDHKKEEPLFSWQDVITIDETWVPSVKGKVETVLGRLLINTIVFVRNVGGRIPYVNKPKFSVKDLEDIIIAKTQNKENMKPGDITVDEMVTCVDGINFFVFASTFTSIAATPKTISPPPGVKDYREKLLKEYGETIKDPVKRVEFEGKLDAFDAEYLKDDPAAAAIFGAKSKASRAKTYYFFGAGLDFIDSKENDTIVSQALIENLNPDPEDLAKYFNDIRYASFSRGNNTALAGYAYKIIQRSLSGISIADTECNTKQGLHRVLNEREAPKFVGRSIRSGDKWVVIDTNEKAMTLLNKPIEVRSTMYCTSPGNTVCYACMNRSYKGMESGTNNVGAGLSAVLMNMFLKLMHSSRVFSNNIDSKDLIS